MKYSLTLPFIFIVAHSFAQNCFDGCNTKLERSNFAVDAGEKIISALVGCDAPSFDLMTLQGRRLKSSDLKGKIVVLNFWYTGCAPCVAEMPALNRLFSEYANDKIEFIALAQDNTEKIKSFLAHHQFSFQIVAATNYLNDRFCLINGWPMNMIIDQQGVVRYVSTGGYVDERANTAAYGAMKPVIEKLLVE